ncbi:PAS domain-containing protein [Aquicoccus sp. SCR17]|nr:PAS domain-containing protein [Carideicomes alvinocaridis]
MSGVALLSMLRAMAGPALLIGADERVIGANPEAEALLGGGMTGRHYITLLRQPALLEAVEACMAGRSPVHSRYLAGTGSNEQTFEVHCARVDSGEIDAVLVSFSDVSAREQAEQMRRDFVANVSHELRTPLTALIGFIETLRGPARDDPAAQQRFLATMETEARRMNRLVHDLLSLSGVEASERMRPTAPVDLAGLVRSVLNGLAPLAEEAEVTLDSDLPGQSLMVPGDADQLRQVITNLVENAIKYGGRGGRVTAALTGPAEEPGLRGRGVRLSVRDTGPGIDPIHIPRLTERFYRVDTHRSRQMGGTGLGLAIVKHIVTRHRGRLKIESAPGEGTTFTAILPAEAAR